MVYKVIEYLDALCTVVDYVVIRVITSKLSFPSNEFHEEPQNKKIRMLEVD